MQFSTATILSVLAFAGASTANSCTHSSGMLMKTVDLRVPAIADNLVGSVCNDLKKEILGVCMATAKCNNEKGEYHMSLTISSFCNWGDVTSAWWRARDNGRKYGSVGSGCTDITPHMKRDEEVKERVHARDLKAGDS